MFAVIDCGTTNTRVYIINDENKIVGRGERRVGVRNTTMTGSKDTLRNGVCEAITEAAENAGITAGEIEFAIASGMITSEIGLKEIPHLIAPAGLEELAASAVMSPGGDAIPMDIPVLFIRGIRNNYGAAILQNIRNVDFMRGEETQVMGILEDFQITEPTTIIVLSSHTKLVHVNAEGKVDASLTTISGQLYEAVCKQTMVGKSLTEDLTEEPGGYTFEQIVDAVQDPGRGCTLSLGPCTVQPVRLHQRCFPYRRGCHSQGVSCYYCRDHFLADHHQPDVQADQSRPGYALRGPG